MNIGKTGSEFNSLIDFIVSRSGPLNSPDLTDFGVTFWGDLDAFCKVAV